MKFHSLFAATAALLIAVGCGGGGNNQGTTPPPGGSPPIRVFITDDLRQDMDRVWVSIKKVELVGAGGNRVLFDQPQGRIVDLRSLRDDQGRRFKLLANRAINAGGYSGISVTVDKSLVIVPTGQTTGVNATFADSGDVNKVLSVNFESPRTISTGTDLVVDFDLANWNLEGTTVTATNGAYLRVVQDDSVGNPQRHERSEYRGRVSGLTGTAPNVSFTLTFGGSTFNIQTDSTTVVYNSNGTPSAVLANGQMVEVTGLYSGSNNGIRATSVKIKNTEDAGFEVKGRVIGYESANKTIVINAMSAYGFIPPTSRILVRFNGTTRFFGSRGMQIGQAQFEARLIESVTAIEAEGTYQDGIFIASKLKIEDEEDGVAGEAEVRGPATSANAEAGTFQIAANEWEGLFLNRGQTVQVSISNTTEFRINGESSTKSNFFAQLVATPGIVVKVSGAYDEASNRIVAREARIGAGGGDDD